MTVDEALALIAEVTAELSRLPENAPERSRLEQRRDELRAAARRAADVSRNPEYLRLELEHLERRLASIDGKLIKIPKWQASMKWMNDPAASISAINRRLEDVDSAERAALLERIGELRAALGETD